MEETRARLISRKCSPVKYLPALGTILFRNNIRNSFSKYKTGAIKRNRKPSFMKQVANVLLVRTMTNHAYKNRHDIWLAPKTNYRVHEIRSNTMILIYLEILFFKDEKGNGSFIFSLWNRNILLWFLNGGGGGGGEGERRKFYVKGSKMKSPGMKFYLEN